MIETEGILRKLAIGVVAVAMVLSGVALDAAAATNSITIVPPTGGRVTSSPGPIDCGGATNPGANCAGTFTVGNDVSLTATPDAGFAFTTWSISQNTSTANPLVQPMPPANLTITVSFIAIHPLSVDVSGPGSGGVTSTPAGAQGVIACGTDTSFGLVCSTHYFPGTSVTVTAAPSSGSLFSGWLGACVGATPTCGVTMNGPANVAATFLPDIARYPGRFDGGFGTGGFVTGQSPAGAPAWQPGGVAIMPGGNIVFAGTEAGTGSADFAVARLSPDGSLDGGFGVQGATVVDFGGLDRGRAVLPGADGSVVVAGEGGAPVTVFALTRLTAAGTLDATFGTNGRVVHEVGISQASIHALAAAPGNKIVAAGYGSNATHDFFVVARYTASGVLDPTFGGGAGVATTGFGNVSDVATAVAVLPDGKIVVAGYSQSDPGGLSFAVARLAVDGTHDAGFGSGGRTTLVPGGRAFAMTLQPDGKILLAGSVGVAMAVARLHATGSIDAGFGSGGIVTIDCGGSSCEARAIAIQTNGKIVVAGRASAGGETLALVRLLPDGSPDAGFWNGGTVFLDAATHPGGAYALALQPDGKIVTAGHSAAQSKWFVARQFGDPGAIGTDFNADGSSDILYRNVSTGQVSRLLMNGAAIAGGSAAYSEANLAWMIVGDADFNGDAVTDLLWRNDATGQVYLQPFGANGLPNGGAIFYTEPNLAWKVVHTPDFDGDGKADLLWRNSSTGQVYAMLMNGSTIGAQGLVYTEANTAWKIVAVGDFAGSGRKNQLLWHNSVTGQVYVMTVTVSGGVFSQSGQMIYTEANTAWKIIGAADVNGDGRSDILWRNAATGQVYGMLMNGGTIASQAIVYTEPNTAWKIVAQGDYDGDGKADLLWRNDATGQVYMMLMNGLSIASQGLVYAEPNTAWKILGPLEYGQ